MVAYLLAVDRGNRDFVPSGDHRSAAAQTATCGRKKTSGFHIAQAARSCRLPTERGRFTPEAPSELFRDWQRTQTQSSVTVFGPETANECPVLQRAGTTAERHTLRAGSSENIRFCALLIGARQENYFFSWDRRQQRRAF